VASYRQTTLTAFQEVEDNLAALRILETEAQQQQEPRHLPQKHFSSLRTDTKGGVDNYLQVITAQTVLLTNERNDIDIQRRRMDASVLLVKAVGGGWDTTQLPKLWGTGGDVGFTRDGTHAEYVVVPRSSLIRKPANLSHEEAGSVGVTFVTAWCGLVEYAALRRGETVAVIGAAGGVGSAAVQIAKRIGARVFAINRSRPFR
jgi:phosphoglycerate dehydrogenase-like enzyme